jgi:hypothetical protein
MVMQWKAIVGVEGRQVEQEKFTVLRSKPD